VIRVEIDTVDADGLLTTFGAGALVRVERAVSVNGSYSEIGTLPLVENIDAYTFWDPAGLATSFYKWRASNAGNTTQSAYSAKFQGIDASDPAAAGLYASIDDVVSSYNQTVPDDVRTRLYDALRDATAQITSLMGFDVFTHGPEARLVEVVRRGNRLCVHDGIVPDEDITLELRGGVHSDWEPIDAEHFVVEPPEKPGHPSFHVRLNGLGSRSLFPAGRDTARIETLFGWPAIPDDWRRAARDRARQITSWDPTRPGGPTGPSELGAMVGPNRMPDSMFRLQYDYSAWELGLAQCEL